MITLSKHASISPFCTIEGDWKLPVGTRGSSYTRWSSIGGIIADTIYHISSLHTSITAEQYVVMPDHVHILLYVRARLPEPLGFYIARFKGVVNSRSGLSHVFEDGFNDQIITYNRNLNKLFDYIRSNPYRLAVRRANPDFFVRSNKVKIGDSTYEAYGNLHLLDNPFKEQVIVHRADAPEVIASRRDRLLYTASNGGVVVSPFISASEKTIRGEAEGVGGRIILITYEQFYERYKPTAHDFALCAEGRLLIITLGLRLKTELSRSICLRMNALAEEIAGGESVISYMNGCVST